MRVLPICYGLTPRYRLWLRARLQVVIGVGVMVIGVIGVGVIGVGIFGADVVPMCCLHPSLTDGSHGCASIANPTNILH